MYIAIKVLTCDKKELCMDAQCMYLDCAFYGLLSIDCALWGVELLEVLKFMDPYQVK